MADKLKGPFRYDIVGSFLRPQAIKNARVQFKAGEITRDDLTSVENEQITLLVEKQITTHEGVTATNDVKAGAISLQQHKHTAQGPTSTTTSAIP